MSWLHTQSAGISLHDYRATYLAISGNQIEFTFEDGFLVLADNEHNPHKRHRKTDRSSLLIRDHTLESVYLFRELRLFGNRIITVRKSITLNELAENINSGKWQLEFITEYTSYYTVLYNCEIWFDHRPYHMECQFEMVHGGIEYNWNNFADEKDKEAQHG